MADVGGAPAPAGTVVGVVRLARAVAAAAALGGGLLLGPSPALAEHEQGSELVVVLAVNAAGGDVIEVYDDWESDAAAGLAGGAADALGFAATPGPPGIADPDGSLLREVPGGLRLDVDTGRLQLLAHREGYEAVVVVVCTPKVSQQVGAVVAPQEGGPGPLGSRCRGWYQAVDDDPVRARIDLRPDRQRYPAALRRTVGGAAVAFAVLGFGATLLRRGPLARRRAASWLLAVAAALLGPVAWLTATVVLWWSGAATDPMLLGGGGVGEQVVRTVLPGTAFLLAGLVPAVVLLGAPRPEPPAPPPSPGPQQPLWWPAAWWPAWAAAEGAGRRP